MLCGIYMLKNTVNGKVYVGQSGDLDARLLAHKNDLKNKRHHCSHLQRSWSKHGEDRFLFVVLELCDSPDLTSREQHWMDVLRPLGLYNTIKAAGSAKGFKHSAQSRANMKAAQNKPERKQRLREAMTGRVFSPETLVKMKTTWQDPEVRARREAGLARVRSTPEYRAKLSAGQLANPNNPRASKSGKTIDGTPFATLREFAKLVGYSQNHIHKLRRAGHSLVQIENMAKDNPNRSKYL